MQQIFRRRAWEPLGYDNPQDLILGEFKDGGLINPRTGKPYGRAHIYRMARTALFLHEVSSRTGVDATELDVAEKALRAARENGVDDVTMLTQIENRVIAAAESGGEQPDSEAVQEIVESVIAEAAGRTPTPPAEEPAPRTTSSGGAPETIGAAPTPPRVPPSPMGDVPLASEGDDPTDWPNTDPPTTNATPASTSTWTIRSGRSVHRPPDRWPPPTGGQSWAETLARTDDFIRFTDTLRLINEMGRKLPEVSQVAEKLPEFLDACDDSELTAFSEALDDVDMLLREIPQIREAIRAIQECTQDRAEMM